VKATVVASQTASGASRSGPRIGRQRLITLHAALEQMFRLVAKQIAHPLRPGLRGMVDMDARRRLPRRAGGAAVGAGNALPPRVIEDEDA
jgi:hypothetical protein